MHGSVCLLSRYLKNLLEGENLDELDISSASGSNNIYRNKKSLSTGWKGTCPILELMFKIQSDVYKEIYSFDTITVIYIAIRFELLGSRQKKIQITG